MSMDLYLWKSPATDDPEEAARLIDRFFDDDEQGVFEPSSDIAATADELRRLYPYWPVSGEKLLAGLSEEERGRYTEQGLAELLEFGSYAQPEDGPWSDIPFHQTDNLLALHIRWHSPDQVLDDVVRIAAEHDLVIYDPQGPAVYRAREAPEQEPVEKPTAKDFLHVMLLFLPIAGATLAAWWFIPWGWLRWPLVAIGLFFTMAAGIVVYAHIEAAFDRPEDEPRTS